MRDDESFSSQAPDDKVVWNLLRQASRPKASPHFVDDTVRAARFEPQMTSGTRQSGWWRKLFAWHLPLAVGGLTTAATAVVVLLVIAESNAPSHRDRESLAQGTERSQALRPTEDQIRPIGSDESGELGALGEFPEQTTIPGSLDRFDDAIVTEALSYAAEDPAAFTDAELVSLIAY